MNRPAPKSDLKIKSIKKHLKDESGDQMALLTIVAWRIHWMTSLGRLAPDVNASLVFTEQKQTILSKLNLKSIIPKNYHLADFIVLLARHGGFLNRKADGFPGAQVLWRGWHKLKEFMYNLALMGGVEATYV